MPPLCGRCGLPAKLPNYTITCFIVRKEEKPHGKHKLIEGRIEKNDRVIIIDDVITTGHSAYEAVNAVEEMNCKVVKVIPIVDRNEGGKEFFEGKGYKYDPIINIEDIFRLEREMNIQKEKPTESNRDIKYHSITQFS